MRNRKGSSIGAITVFLTAVALGMLFSALLVPRSAWGQALGVLPVAFPRTPAAIAQNPVEPIGTAVRRDPPVINPRYPLDGLSVNQLGDDRNRHAFSNLSAGFRKVVCHLPNSDSDLRQASGRTDQRQHFECPIAEASNRLDVLRPIGSRGGGAHAGIIAQSAPKYKHFLPLGGALLGYLGGTIDRDAGGYRDSFRFQPDKQAHLLASVILSKAVADGTSVKLGLATCLVAGAAWEAGQRRHSGYASPYDLTFDAGGCLLGALWGRR